MPLLLTFLFGFPPFFTCGGKKNKSKSNFTLTFYCNRQRIYESFNIFLNVNKNLYIFVFFLLVTTSFLSNPNFLFLLYCSLSTTPAPRPSRPPAAATLCHSLLSLSLSSIKIHYRLTMVDAVVADSCYLLETHLFPW